MSSRKKSFFWASYSDLMTNLFFIMLVLFIISIVELKQIGFAPKEVKTLKQERDSLMLLLKQYDGKLDSMIVLTNVTKAQIDKINEINDATKNLSRDYFIYDSVNKKHKLNFDVKFSRDDDTIYNLSLAERNKLLSVGRELQNFIDSASTYRPEVQYLLIIEGQASKDGVNKMDYNYGLSYRRAKNLKKFWDSNRIMFGSNNCEVLISGSGDGRLSGTGLMREKIEEHNQRFLIHILPKPGKIK